MPRTDEWFTMKVICKETDHSLAPDAIVAIHNLLIERGFKDVDVEWFWGSEPPAATCRIDKTPPNR